MTVTAMRLSCNRFFLQTRPGVAWGRGESCWSHRIGRNTPVDLGQGTTHPSVKRRCVDVACWFRGSSKSGVGQFSTTST